MTKQLFSSYFHSDLFEENSDFFSARLSDNIP